ncbi:hypothetical protein D3C71_1986660 [compost metagenome]
MITPKDVTDEVFGQLVRIGRIGACATYRKYTFFHLPEKATQVNIVLIDPVCRQGIWIGVIFFKIFGTGKKK